MSAGEGLVGTTLGSYRIESQLGSGATGIVYRATPVAGGEPVALKVLHDNLGSISGLERRFAREARVLEKLSHPNIVEIKDFGIDEGRTFIAMKLLVGQTLEQRLEKEPLAPADAVRLYVPILSALAVAHEHEVVHRDLKPANVFLEEDGGVKLLDFGLAKMLSVEDTAEEATLTRKGRIVGTPAYMAPEQITGVFIDVRADVYALGVMLYELLADRRPFLYERRSELLRAHLLEPVPAITKVRPGLSVEKALEKLLAKALEKDAGRRYRNAAEMLAALRALPDPSVSLEGKATSPSRKRTEPTSAVISAEERRAITESAGISSSGQGASAPSRGAQEPGALDGAPQGAAAQGGRPRTSAAKKESREQRERDQHTVKVKTVAAPPPPAVSTGALFALAAALLGVSVVLWVFLIGLR